MEKDAEKFRDIEQFKEYELYPTLFESIDIVFPELHFKRVGGQWQSKCHALTPEDSESHAITYVYANSKFCAKDQATGEATELIKLYAEHNGIDRNLAIKKLCEILGLTPPLMDNKKWEDYETTQKNRESAKAVFLKSLQEDAPEAKRVRDYFTNRGWTQEDVKAVEIGLITTPIRQGLPDGDNYKGLVKVSKSDVIERRDGITIVKSKDTRRREKAEGKVASSEEEIIGGVGTTHSLVIPFYSGSVLRGFKFRHLGQLKDDEGKDYMKYLNSCGLGKGASLFGIGIGIKDIVIVEGDLDALHAKAKGIDNVVATAGSGATKEQIADAIKRGVEKFTLLFDNDKYGRQFAAETIRLIQPHDKCIYVAKLPDEVKDLDEYLCTHTKEEFAKIVVEAPSYTTYLFDDIVEKFYQKEIEKGYVTDKERDEFFSEVKRLQNSPYTKPYDRQLIRDRLEFRAADLHINIKDFDEWEEREYQQRQAAQRIAKAEYSIQQISEALKVGDIETALDLMRRTHQNINGEANEEKYSKYLRIPTEESERNEWRDEADEIETPYYFENTATKDIEQLTLPSGAITFVCAPTSHGKSTFLQNLALSVAQNEAEGSTLYFTYEESTKDVKVQFENKYINAPLSHNNLRSIKNYKRKGIDMFSKGRLDTYLTGAKAFSDKLYYSGKLRIFGEHFDSTELMEMIRYSCTQMKVKAVFIDYIQKISKKGFKGQRRNEELKEICDDFNTLSIELHLPIVIAAQLNREAKSPIEMFAQNIKEAAEIEQVANKVILLWNSSFKAQGNGSPELGTWSANTGITLGSGGSIYALLSKNRGGIANIEAVFTHKGNEGVIFQRKPTLQQIEEAKKAEAREEDYTEQPSSMNSTNEEVIERDDLPF